MEGGYSCMSLCNPLFYNGNKAELWTGSKQLMNNQTVTVYTVINNGKTGSKQPFNTGWSYPSIVSVLYYILYTYIIQVYPHSFTFSCICLSVVNQSTKPETLFLKMLVYSTSGICAGFVFIVDFSENLWIPEISGNLLETFEDTKCRRLVWREPCHLLYHSSRAAGESEVTVSLTCCIHSTKQLVLG